MKMDKPYFLMNAKEKERARKRKIKETQRALNKQIRALEKYQEKVLTLAQKAQEANSVREFNYASRSLGTIIKCRHYIQAMSLRMDVLDVMSSVAAVTSKTFSTLDKISKETVKIADKLNADNAIDNMEEVIDRMNDMFEEMDELLSVGEDQEADEETQAQINRMIEETRIAQQGAIDSEIDALLAQNGLKAAGKE